MKIYVKNVQSEISVGGRDHLVDPDLFDTLREYMSVAVPGAYFSSAYKKRQWDGRRYFITPKGKMATGFLPTFLKFVEEEYPELEVEIVDQREDIPRFKKEFVSSVGSWELSGKYQFQQELLKTVDQYIEFRDQKIYFPRGIIDAATNAGKTAIIAGLYKNLEGSQRMLVLIHRRAIFDQLVTAMESVVGEVGQIKQNKYKLGPITIAMVGTLHNRLSKVNAQLDLKTFGVIVADESHHAGSKTYSKVLQKCPAGIRVFLSGTAFDGGKEAIVAKMIMVGLSGPKIAHISKKELMDAGISTKVDVVIHPVNTILHDRPITYDEWIDTCIHRSTERAGQIKNIIKSGYLEGLIVIAVDYIEHGKYILYQLKEWAEKEGIVIMLTHGKDQNQATKIEACKEGEIDVLISTGILQEGVNIPRIRHLVYAIGKKGKISIKQWMGRAERLLEGKDKAVFHDFMDVGKFVLKDSMQRRQLYISEDLKVIELYDYDAIKRVKSVVIN